MLTNAYQGRLFAFVLFSLAFISLGLTAQKTEAQEVEREARLFFFYSESCPHCAAEEKFLDDIKDDHPNLKIYDFSVSSKEGSELFNRVAQEHNVRGVPVTIIGDEAIVGFDNAEGIGERIENKIEHCSESTCRSFLENVIGLPAQEELEKERTNIESGAGNAKNQDVQEDVKIFGKTIGLSEEKSLFFLGIVLGLADGINPCMFSVLLFLLTYLMAIGSQKRALKAGIAFIVTTFFVYLLFMYGIIKVVDVLNIESQVRAVVAVVAVLIGLVMIKDYFFYGKWFSFEISDKYKPKLEALSKKGTVLSAILLAFFSSLIELPCTSGIPLAYISVLSIQDVNKFWYLIWYNLFFVLPLLVIVLGVVFAWKKVEVVEKWRERSKKYMRLAAGIILILLAIAIWRNWL
ncbi:MAG: hypothetical protein R6V40_00415 [Candidatus Moraniibacteriota bacterium]